MNAREAAEALVAVLGMRFGEITIRVVDGDVVLLRHGTTLKRADLDRLEVPVPPADHSPRT